MKNHINQIEEIANEFAISGDFISGVEIDSGHINSTYLVEFGSDDGSKNRYILQRINEAVFPDPKALKRGETLLDGVAKNSELSDYLKNRLASLQNWNETALGLLPALSLLD